jgi:FkbM family methyltransferase
MPEAAEFLARVEAKYRSHEIDWEELLEVDYLHLLSGRGRLNIIDVGGHAGRHSRVMVEQLQPAHLFIFEPLPEQCQLLRELFANEQNVTVYNIALGNTCGEAKFVVKRGALGESGLRQRTFYNDGHANDLEYISVAVETLDALDIPFKVDFVKIDTEGGEMDILRGGLRVLKTGMPIISVEYGPGGYDAYGYGPDTLFEFAAQNDYDLFDLFGNRFASLEEWRACVARFYYDFLLIPKAQLLALADRLEGIRTEARARFS